MPTTPDPQLGNNAGAPAQTSGASSRTRDEMLAWIRERYLALYRDRQACVSISQDYGAIEQHVVAASLQQEELRCLLEQNPPRRNPWPFETWANLKLTQEDFIMSKHNDNFIVNRITHVDLEAHLDHLLAHYSEGTAEGDDIKACFEVQGSLSMRDEETAAKFQERCAFLAACYASKSFPPKRDTLKVHVLSMLTAATRTVLGEYGVFAASANGNGHAVLDTGRASVFNALERVVKDRVDNANDANPSSLFFHRDAPPRDWVYADKTAGFMHDKQAHADELKREMALVETMAVVEDVKQLMRMYLIRAGNNYANTLRYYHTVSILNVFRNHADNYTALLFYSYEVNGAAVRGLQYGTDAGDYIEGFGGR